MEEFKKPTALNFKQPKNILKESVFSIIKNYKKEGNASCYEPIIKYLKVKPPPSKLCCHWLSQLKDVVPLLDRSTENIILSTLLIPWQYGDEAVELHIHNFVLSLLTAHNYFVAPILECLFKQLIPVFSPKDSESLRLEPYRLEEQEQLVYYKTLNLIRTISKHVPLCQNLILKSAQTVTPYFKHHVHIHVMFTYNMLLLSQLMPHLRKSLFEIIFFNILKLDLHSPRSQLEEGIEESDNESEDMFNMEEESEQTSQDCITAHEIGHSLDMVMTVMYRFIHFTTHGGKNFKNIIERPSTQPFEVNGCRAGSCCESESQGSGGCWCNGKGHDVAALKQLYMDLKCTFMKIVLPTHSTAHLQFIMFYILSVRPSLVSDFLDSLRSVFERPENALEERKNAVSYLGSLLARGKFVKFSHVHYCLEILYNFCKSYLQSETAQLNSFEDVRLHKAFYFACQTLFYVFTFNYKEYTEPKSRIRLAQSLHFDELVLSLLNPLRFCSEAIAMNFAAVACHYQLAYCYTILNNNSRVFLPIAMENSYGVFEAQLHSLDMSFPFDPYLLKRSSSLVSEHYKQFEGLPEHILRHAVNLKSELENFDSKGDCDSEMEEDESSPCFSPKSLPRLE